MKKYDKQDQRLMATWAADCVERVLPFFEKAYPKDDRPRKAIEACRTWVRTGVFKMADIRGASLAAHAAARDAKENSAACFAARAAGQAVATAHVPQHAFGGAYYALLLRNRLILGVGHRTVTFKSLDRLLSLEAIQCICPEAENHSNRPKCINLKEST
jgi:hypothetical protein